MVEKSTFGDFLLILVILAQLGAADYQFNIFLKVRFHHGFDITLMDTCSLFRKCWPHRKLAVAAFSQVLWGGSHDNHYPPKPFPQTPKQDFLVNKKFELTSSSVLFLGKTTGNLALVELQNLSF